MASLSIQSGIYSQRQMVQSRRYPDITAGLLKKSTNYSMLEREVELIKLLPLLKDAELISEDQIKQLKMFQHRKRKVGELLDVLFYHDDPRWLDVFLGALEQSGQADIIKKLQGIIPFNTPYRIRPQRGKNVELRVLLYENTIEDTVRRSMRTDVLRRSREVFNSDAVNIYQGSICFLLDAHTAKVAGVLCAKRTMLPKVQEFLFSILKDRQVKDAFKRNRLVTIELKEKPNDFVFRLSDSQTDASTEVIYERRICSDCYRKTVIAQYVTIIDEIESTMMEHTFQDKGDLVPECIRQACLYEKEERSREERADIFLRFVLTDEELLLRFRQVLSHYSTLQLKTVPCEAHSGEEKVQMKLRYLKLYFEVSFGCTDIVITSLQNKERRQNLLKETKLMSREKSDMRYIQEECIRHLKKRLPWKNGRKIQYPKGKQFIPERSITELQDIRSIKDSEIRVLVIGDNPDGNNQAYKILLRDSSLWFDDKQIQPRVGCNFDEYFEKKIAVTSVPCGVFETDSTIYRTSFTNCVIASSPGPHVVLIPMVKEQLNENIDAILTKVINLVGIGAKKHILVGCIRFSLELLKNCSGSSPILSDLIANGQCTEICSSNRINLLKKVAKMVSDNVSYHNKEYFTNATYQKAQETINMKLMLQRNAIHDTYRRLEIELAQLEAAMAPRKLYQQQLKDIDEKFQVISNLLQQGVQIQIIDEG